MDISANDVSLCTHSDVLTLMAFWKRMQFQSVNTFSTVIFRQG